MVPIERASERKNAHAERKKYCNRCERRTVHLFDTPPGMRMCSNCELETKTPKTRGSRMTTEHRTATATDHGNMVRKTDNIFAGLKQHLEDLSEIEIKAWSKAESRKRPDKITIEFLATIQAPSEPSYWESKWAWGDWLEKIPCDISQEVCRHTKQIWESNTELDAGHDEFHYNPNPFHHTNTVSAEKCDIVFLDHYTMRTGNPNGNINCVMIDVCSEGCMRIYVSGSNCAKISGNPAMKNVALKND